MISFRLDEAIQILESTPATINALLKGKPEAWINNNEGNETWSPFDVVGHLVHGEKTDWISRMKIILMGEGGKSFEPFDRFAQFETSKGKTMDTLLDEFASLRKRNIETLKGKNLQENDLDRKGIHPSLGEVTLRQLLATWTVHDLSHIAQICRVMSKQYTDEVGPWKAYIPLLSK